MVLTIFHCSIIIGTKLDNFIGHSLTHKDLIFYLSMLLVLVYLLMTFVNDFVSEAFDQEWVFGDSILESFQMTETFAINISGK